MAQLESVPSAIAEIELSFKPSVKASLLPEVHSPQEAYELLRKVWDESKIDFLEHFKIMLLNRANKVLGICTVCTGTVTSAMCDPKLAFAIAIKANAVGLILCHNHPSGSLKPSPSDIELTAKMVQVGKFMDLKVMDHLIITSEGYYSFADEGDI